MNGNILTKLSLTDHSLNSSLFNLSSARLDILDNFNYDFTTTAGLTSFLSGTNIDFSTATTAELLSAFNTEIEKFSKTLIQSLSTEAIHPYDLVKMSLFGPEYKFPTIDDIEVPEEVTTQSIVDKLKQQEKTYRSNLLDYMHNKETFDVTGFHDHVSILSELSGEKNFVVTEKRFKNYIEALEIITSIDRESINEENYSDYYKKIGYCLTKVLSQKTVS